jgi:uncharacterized SAM-binding protein YcdF (DUF218 family)
LSRQVEAEAGRMVETGKPPRRSSLLPGLTSAILFGAIVLAAGFIAFAKEVSSAHPPTEVRADAIVALTGGPNRIEDAAKLLSSGSAGRMLISGVNPHTTREALADLYGALDDLFRCCIDIGYEALDTRGNASEAARWVRERGFRSVIVVTSAYHMPRTLTELRRVLPEADLIPYPVESGYNLATWPRNKAVLKLLALEYGKYLLAQLG